MRKRTGAHQIADCDIDIYAILVPQPPDIIVLSAPGVSVLCLFFPTENYPWVRVSVFCWFCSFIG